MRRGLLLLIMSLALGACAPTAEAKEWCVAPASGCADGIVTFQSALDQAKSNAGPDQIRLGAATYDGPFTYDDNGSSANNVTITGAGSTATTLTRSSLGAILTITSSGGALNSLTDLGFHITQSSSAGLQGGRADTTRVAVAGDPAITNSTGVALGAGGVRSVHITMPVSGSNTGVLLTGAVAGDGVFDSTVSADNAVNVPLAVVQRCDVTGGHFGVATQSGRVDDVVVHVSGTGPDRAGLDATNNSIADGSAVARHLTIVGGSADPGSIGIRVFGDSAFTGHTESLDVRNTIVRGVEHSYKRATHTAAPAGTANLTMHYTDYDPATRDDSGLGTGPNPSDPTNSNTDPLFVDSSHSDFRLAYNSPLIDAGDPAALAGDEPDTDAAGGSRVINGRTDIGAFEYQRRPPVITSATAMPSAAQVGTPFTFTATATDPDADPVSYAWSFDDGGAAPGASVQHAFAAPGIHVATVTATDGAGLTSMKTVAVNVIGGPVLSSLKLVPSKFRAAKGTSVRFTLNVAAPIKFRVDRSAAGRRVNGKCRKPTTKNRGRKKCTRHLGLKGSFSRKGVAGANQFHWNGRLNGKALKPGSYRLIATTGTKVRSAAFKIKP